jgi:4-hydroxy-3-methylbut-2-enyl diphosphate reductase
MSDIMVVIGAPNSSNSMRLVEVGKRYGARDSMLVQRATDMDWDRIGDGFTVGITAGASAPETLVEEVIAAFDARYDITLETVSTADEDVIFHLPRALRVAAADSSATRDHGRLYRCARRGDRGLCRCL